MYANIEEFKELIKTYSGFTNEFLDSKFLPNYKGIDVLNELTGFGYEHTCNLCRPCSIEYGEADCSICLWNYGQEFWEETMCFEISPENYAKIKHAKNGEELYSALQKRIKMMKRIIKKYEKENKNETND